MKESTKRLLKKMSIALMSLILCLIMCFAIVGCGTEGPAGKDGTNGVDGLPGATGSQGPKGDKGDPGDSATEGSTYTPSGDITETTLGIQTANHGFNSGALESNGKFFRDHATQADARAASAAMGTEIGAEGFTLLHNVNNALPLVGSENRITPFGIKTYWRGTIFSGGGSGAGANGNNIGVDTSYGSSANITLMQSYAEAGFQVNPATHKIYDNLGTRSVVNIGYFDQYPEISVSNYTIDTVSTYRGYNDAAVITFGRTATENRDAVMHDVYGHADADEHYLQLDDNERDLVKHAKKYFNKVIVLLNTSNIMQVPDLCETKTADNLGVDAVLWVGSLGGHGARAVGQILRGTVNPSGHTVHVWEKDFKKAPTWTNYGYNSQNKDLQGNRLDAYYYTDEGDTRTKFASVEYREGIYSSYRYYETIYDEIKKATNAEAAENWYNRNVLFPFGHGLSYTNFEWKLDNVAKTGTIAAHNQTVTMRVWVKNTGSYPGKDVVQVYSNPPYTANGIEKAAANLISFGKTRLLQPGESDVVTISFPAQDLASFDWNDANGNSHKGYELEAGDYIISVRRNAHEVVDEVTRTVATGGIKITHDYYTGNKIEPVFTDDSDGSNNKHYNDFRTVNKSLLDNMLTRGKITAYAGGGQTATAWLQPATATKEDRTLGKLSPEGTKQNFSYKNFEDQFQLFAFEDKPTDAWYINSVPASWTQDPTVPAANASGNVTTAEPEDILLKDMAGVPYIEPDKNGNYDYSKFSNVANSYAPGKSVRQWVQEGTDKWIEFMNQLSYQEMVWFIGNNASRLNSTIGYTSSMGEPDGPVKIADTQFPSNPVVAATWSPKLAEKYGDVLASEKIWSGSNSAWRGTGANIHRSPFLARCFEYFSEDGVLAGIMSSKVTKGISAKGIICFVKHAFGNDQETFRADYGGVATWATEQVLREITARPFEMMVKEGRTMGLMSSFSRIGGITTSSNYAVHEKLIRQEWGFNGMTECDRWAKEYVPLNMMWRAGDSQILGTDTEHLVGAAETGTWDPTARDGKGLVKVGAKNPNYNPAYGVDLAAKPSLEYNYGSAAPQRYLYDPTGTESMLSMTHYYAFRKSCQRSMYAKANTPHMQNGIVSGQTIEVTIEAGRGNVTAPISIDGSAVQAIALREGEGMRGLPTGVSFVTGLPMLTIASAGTLPSVGIHYTDVSVTVDRGITVNMVLKINVVSALQFNGQAITDKPITAKLNTAWTGGTFKIPSMAPYQRFGALAVTLPTVRNDDPNTWTFNTTTTGNNYCIPWYTHYRGVGYMLAEDDVNAAVNYCRNEDKGAADVITYSADVAKQRFEYGWMIVGSDDTKYVSAKNAETGMRDGAITGVIPGLTFTPVATPWVSKNGPLYDILDSFKVSGTPTTAGTYTFTVRALIPYCTGSPWQNAGGMQYFDQAVTIVIS